MLLALDLSYNLGWALWAKHLQKPLWGVKNFASGSRKGTGALIEALPKFHSWLEKMIIENKVTEIAIESVLITKNFSSVEPAFAWRAIVFLLVGQRAIRVHDVSISEWRKYFIGVGGAPRAMPQHKRRPWLKAKAVERCGEMGWHVTNDDEAEALGILDFVRATIDPQRGTETAPLFSPLF